MAAFRVAAGASLVASCAAFVAPAPEVTSLRRAGVAQPQVSGASSTAATAAFGIAAAGLTAAALRASGASVRSLRRTERRVVGVVAPLTEPWDPLKLGNTDAKLDRYTAVEIKHGRVSMLAVLGYIMPEIFRFPGCEGFENGLGALSTIPVEGWAQMMAMLAAHEVLVKPRQGGLGTFDFGFGTEVLQGATPEEVERRQSSERSNGRLAMIAIMGLLVQDGMFGKTPLALLKSDGLWGPSVDFIIKDIAFCYGGSVCATGRTTMRAMAYEREPKPSPSVPYLNQPEALEGWVGDKGFDPLGVTDALPVFLLREAELKHGRVCMLATIGWIATDLGARFPGEVFQGVANSMEAHNKLVDGGIMAPLLGAIGTFELYSYWLIDRQWAGDLIRDAGDYYLGKRFLPAEEAKANEMKLKELENGRLAMFAFSGIVAQAVITGKPWPFL